LTLLELKEFDVTDNIYMQVQIYKDWDDEKNEGIALLSDSGIWSMPLESFSTSVSTNPLAVIDKIKSSIKFEAEIDDFT
jgi:hypothetical protein